MVCSPLASPFPEMFPVFGFETVIPPLQIFWALKFPGKQEYTLKALLR
jgi:hypothetical protein